MRGRETAASRQRAATVSLRCGVCCATTLYGVVCTLLTCARTRTPTAAIDGPWRGAQGVAASWAIVSGGRQAGVSGLCSGEPLHTLMFMNISQRRCVTPAALLFALAA